MLLIHRHPQLIQPDFTLYEGSVCQECELPKTDCGGCTDNPHTIHLYSPHLCLPTDAIGSPFPSSLNLKDFHAICAPLFPLTRIQACAISAQAGEKVYGLQP